ncbi:adenylosuccinate lyase [Cryobacterium mesophilum]|uniref:Adenylosuccinate lyase n=1 Tax=Terrimesophilobacter mesophilus TaxID=433647 RepID=A0A4R8V9K4_9MICO|nr:adenylosuccinate lyase [Terrimesophilobacter mesophilus]MBB5633086.1 adenylosuccinate lyase [Terrimesophilobacter mesophilus]TFB79844.1 adenylosuccinate lyase [Terrimesophilobacter mesophilus]
MTTLSNQPLSPLDGRYREAVAELGEHLSEAALNRARVNVEIEWLLFLTDRRMFGTTPLTDVRKTELRRIVGEFGDADIRELAELEATTRHDVKAVEYLLRRRLDSLGIRGVSELVHFAATSEDINNIAYALCIDSALRSVWLPKFRGVIRTLRTLALENRSLPMLAHTHGQPATPTTVGKEFAVFVHRLDRLARQIDATESLAKFSGATGTYAAHLAAAPDADWPAMSRSFVESLGLAWNPLTTQIESHDWQAELYSRMSHANRVLHNLCTDIWAYISMGYITQVPVAGATGSSTMPHKVNPIRFENAEANLELSSAVLDSLVATLVTSRLQRDLTDSSAQRNIGVGFGHSVLALDNIQRGLGEIALNPQRLAQDLDANWEVLAEAIQTVIRAEITAGRSSISDPYALLKELTRGRRVGPDELAEFIGTLDIGADAKVRLSELVPSTYIGIADRLVDYLD